MAPVEPLEACQERAVVGVEDAAGDVDLEVRVHADQVGVEGRVVERGHADSVGDGCGAALFVRLGCARRRGAFPSGRLLNAQRYP